MYFDSHAHYDDARFNEDRDELITKMHAESVSYILNSGESMRAIKTGLQLAEKYPFIYTAVGIHPHNVKTMTDSDLAVLKLYSKKDKVVAIGEIGLDYYYDNSPRDLQRQWFKKQLQLAKEVDLPVIIHSRDAAQECFDIIKESGVNKGVIHCYSGSAQMALDYISMGYYLGIGGVVTYSNAKKTVEVVEAVPIERIVIETDCPYLSPVPNRGKRNDSLNLKFVVDKISEIKNMSHNDVARITTENAKALYSIKG
ncbi:MAG: TatD family hydrolase [Lachnospiraceae bacterium]|nr:TatD family hydrolase [Lachnospiraceae bacterium]